MKKYVHKVNYYETDKMGVTHHSNYIRWMEEARVYFLESIGFPYDQLEDDGIISPVIGINCEYKESTTFNDEIEIEVSVKEVKGIRAVFEYIMKNKNTQKLVAKGISEHCFLNKSGKLVKLSREFPEFDFKLKELSQKSI